MNVESLQLIRGQPGKYVDTPCLGHDGISNGISGGISDSISGALSLSPSCVF